jgi:hypothetical protein
VSRKRGVPIKIEFDVTYHCGIRKGRLRLCLLQRCEVIYNLSLLEEVMKKSFQKVLKIKPPRDFFTFRRLLYLGRRSP